MATYSLAEAKNQLSKLVDQALTGEPVTITRHGKAVAHLTSAEPVGRAMDKEMLNWLAKRRATRPRLKVNSVDVIRAMRDER
jgi:prevent-host-death family protein